jgi:hypothetical protein
LSSKNNPQGNLATPECDSIWSPVDLSRNLNDIGCWYLVRLTGWAIEDDPIRPRIPRKQALIVAETATTRSNPWPWNQAKQSSMSLTEQLQPPKIKVDAQAFRDAAIKKSHIFL